MTAQLATFGQSLRFWRNRRGLSQMAFSHFAGFSTKHLSFLETGRSLPSRETVLVLAEALGLALRERNHLLRAAGFEPGYSHLSLEDPTMAPIRLAVDAIMQKHEPFPAMAFLAKGDIVQANHAARHLISFLAGPQILSRFQNVYRLFFSPDGLRPYIENFEELAEMTLARAREDMLLSGDQQARLLFEELLAFTGKEGKAEPAQVVINPPVFSLKLKKDQLCLDVISVISTFGTPHDITAQELRLETFFPNDASTRRWFEQNASY